MAAGERAVRDLIATFGRADCVAANNDRVLVTDDYLGGWIVWGWKNGMRIERPEVYDSTEALIAALSVHSWLDEAHDWVALYERYRERDGRDASAPLRLWRSLG